jgi:phosphoglycerate kinase
MSRSEEPFGLNLTSFFGFSLFSPPYASAAHRKHASVVGVPAAISGPCAAGLLMAKEVKYLCAALPQRTPDATASSSEAGSDASAAADRPHAAAIVGGVKVDSKLPVFANLVKRVDRLLVGGAMALPFLVAQGKLPADVRSWRQCFFIPS